MNAHNLAASNSVPPISSALPPSSCGFPILSTAPRPPRLLLAMEPESPWAARAFGEDVPPASLGDARSRRDELRTLLGRERIAAADFLLALADFDRRRGWERLGHASLFAFLTRELGLSAGAAQLRLSAARLLPRHPAVEAALRNGQLCLSAAGQLARVLTPGNEAEVLPRFLGRSSREAQEVAATILPAPVPVRRELLTCVGAGRKVEAPLDAPVLTLAFGPAGDVAGPTCPPVPASHEAPCQAPAPASAAPGPALLAPEVPARTGAPRPTSQVVPLTADLRRLHLTVTAGFIEQVARARIGLSHSHPGATTEQVLEAALAALLKKQARRKGLGERALRAANAGPATPAAPPQRATPLPPSPISLFGVADRPHVPAGLERAVRLRDGDRCQNPLDSGGVCGSTWQVELDHIFPVALGGQTTLANLRCLCRVHNRAAAREVLGQAAQQRRPSARRRKGTSPPPGGEMRGPVSPAA